MAEAAQEATITEPRATVWGLTPVQVHDRFWAARGVQVVRQGEKSEVVEGAELYLLTGSRSQVTFGLRDLVETLSWLKPLVLMLRLRDSRERGFREHAIADEEGRFVRFKRVYRSSRSPLARVALTPEREIAMEWQRAESPRAGWRRIRALVPVEALAVRAVPGRVFDIEDDEELMACIRHLVTIWKLPDSTIGGITKVKPGVWKYGDALSGRDADFEGPAWIGASREVPDGAVVVGPTVIWDKPEARPELSEVQWQDLEPHIATNMPIRPPERSLFRKTGKRLFDILFSLAALLLTLPLWPIIMLAILIEDGWPIFFGHRRESMGGREFKCLKFRSMRRDSERVAKSLAEQNLADGPQVYVKDDPRVTRTGVFLRKTHLDELPQFLNVLAGHMSVVGPRPSPFDENQFCPAWRDARLSVRPGITGLWQVRRTREAGRDFQEWIKYDIHYVESGNWRMDLWIIWQTVLLLFRGRR